MNWQLTQMQSWPFRYRITDENGVEIIKALPVWFSSSQQTTDEVLSSRGILFDQVEVAAKANERQLSQLQMMAAAPQLLAACEEVLEAMRMAGWGDEHLAVKCCDAVAKAKGAKS